jgi:multisubunit Na+/H+ antiporter MnhB subunit
MMVMLLSLVSKLLAALLVSVITLATITLLFSQTLLNSHYIENKLSTTNSYNRLSDALATEISKQADPPDPTLKDKLKTVLTANVLQQKLTLGLDQLQAYYQGKGPAPSIPVDDLKARALAAGVPVGDGNDKPLSKPITFSGNNQIQGIGKKFDQVKWASVLAAVVLTLLLLFVSWERHRWAALPDVLISVGVLLGVWVLVFGAGPGMAQHYIKFNFDSNALAKIGHDLAVALSHDLSKRLAMVAIAYFAVGLAARLYLARQGTLKLKQKPAKA